MGLFVTLEGPEGGGKSTHVQHLDAALGKAGWTVRRLREPGGSALGNALRSILLESAEGQMSPRAEALLYAAARAQLVVEAIEPALHERSVVLSDRYADSTLAYQGYGRGLPLPELRAVLRFAIGDRWPDLTLLLDLPVELGLARKAAGAGAEWNRFEAEGLAFHERVRSGYLELAAAEPQRWLVLDATRPFETLAAEIWDAVARRLPNAR